MPCGNYRRGVFRPAKTYFANRGISPRSLLVTAGVVLIAFGLGLGAGWLTDGLPAMLRAEPSPSPSPSVSTGIDPVVEPSLPPLAPITRALTADDREAGVTTTDYVVRGEGTFSVVPGTEEPDSAKGDVRWVSVSVEDGVVANGGAFRNYVMDILNANRAWGSGGTLQYVATDGVADYRVILASPYTTEVICPDPHVAVVVGPVTEATASAAPTPSDVAIADDTAAASGAATEPADSSSTHLCGEDGVIVLSMYDWTAGLPAYGEDYPGARTFMVLHRIGHLRGLEESTCTSGRADIMDSQEQVLPAECQPNPWPFPDAVEELPQPSESPSPVASRVLP